MGCAHHTSPSPDLLYRSIEHDFVSGELAKSEAEAAQATAQLELDQTEDRLWRARFLLLQARVRIYQGRSPDALTLLHNPLLAVGTHTTLAVTRSTLLAIAYSRTGDLARAATALADAQQQCLENACRASVLLVQGIIDGEKGRLDAAEHDFSQSLASAERTEDQFQQVQALLNLGVNALRQEHYDDALTRLGRASELAKKIGARLALEIAAGAVGSTYYKVGDYRRALASSRIAEEQARALGSPIDQVAWLSDIGLSQARLGDLEGARVSYGQSLALARSLANDEETGNALTAIAYLSLEKHDTAGALAQSREATLMAHKRGDTSATVQPLLVQALARIQGGDYEQAEADLLALERGAASRTSARWQIEGALARLYAKQHCESLADTWFLRAMYTFRKQRLSVANLETRLPFAESGSTLYLDAMEHEIALGHTNAALAILDQSRAATLAEALGPTGQEHPGAAKSMAPTRIAANLEGAVLVYCLRPGTSYLWAVTPQRTAFFRLPGQAQIEPLVEAHARSISASRDLLADTNSAGSTLFQLLIQPALPVLAPKGKLPGKIFVIAGEGLHALNFETLLAPGPRPHYWIEDATIVDARSLSMLARSRPAPAQNAAPGQKLLLVGDPVYSGTDFARLPFAAQEAASVLGHYPAESSVVLTGANATPQAFRNSKPARFDVIHFVAHGTANELTPLDSSVILSAPADAPESGKLYAREIVQTPLHADLVTLSACYGSGIRSYSGEGLVGLAWAFLRAGAHYVVGALWDVNDTSTPQLMSDFYTQLVAGRPPCAALRQAKLAMISRGGVFRKPYYWAAFQLYAGS